MAAPTPIRRLRSCRWRAKPRFTRTPTSRTRTSVRTLSRVCHCKTRYDARTSTVTMMSPNAGKVACRACTQRRCVRELAFRERSVISGSNWLSAFFPQQFSGPLVRDGLRRPPPPPPSPSRARSAEWLNQSTRVFNCLRSQNSIAVLLPRLAEQNATTGRNLSCVRNYRGITICDGNVRFYILKFERMVTGNMVTARKHFIAPVPQILSDGLWKRSE